MEALSSSVDDDDNNGETAEPSWASSDFAAAVPAANEVPFGAAAVLLSLGVTALLSILLIGFPAEMFNKTLLEHYEEIRGWFRWVPGWLTAAPERSPLFQFALFTLIATTVTTFLEPGAGFDRETLPLALSFLVTIPLVTLAYALPAEIYYRRISGTGAKIQILPLSLGAAALCAAVTRIGHFLPGYVYGLMAEYRCGEGRRLEKEHEGQGLLVGAVVVFGVSLLAWQLAGATDAAAASDTASFGLRFGDNVLKQTFVVGLEGLVFALIPLRLLDGDKVKNWSLTAWTIMYGLALFFFVHVLVVTRWLEDQDRASVVRMLALFVAFALLSLSFWAYFNFRGPRVAAHDGTP
ncbi:MAG: hypothetical protein M3252_05170 [Actinomycetota bacterium]|nr:hypothetical protein [Actinomycetota bacterium]